MIFPKTHDLEALLHSCRSVYPEFSAYAEHARTLTPLATEFRYPGDVFEPDPASAHRAFELAEEVFIYCDKLVRDEVGGD